MPGYKVFLEDNGDVRKGLKCSYCNLLLNDPVQTSESGLRFCRECFKDAKKDAAYVDELDPNDDIWPDSAVKREIANLRVKCENYNIGCDWKGLFKQLVQHSQECQYVTVECSNTGCGQQVVKAKMEANFKEECSQREVECKDCGKKMQYVDLQDHVEMCPKAPRLYKYFDKTVPAHKIIDHREHIGSESTKALEITKAYQQATKRIDMLENYRQEDAQRIKMLEDFCQEVTKMLQKKDELLEMQAMQNQSEIQELKNTVMALKNMVISNKHSCNQLLDFANQSSHTVNKVQRDMREFENRFGEMKRRADRDHLDVAACLQDINIAAATASANSVMPHEKPPEVVKHLGEKIVAVEGKVLEVEYVNNILRVCYSELELQLEASLASTHNGAFLWRIPEVRQKVRDAKLGCITSIHSPPFYTGRNGYKMCIRAYLNGDGSGEGTHLSIFFVLMKGEYDPLLQWPFESKVSLILVDQDHMNHIVQSFKPDLKSSSFQKPKTDMNVASGFLEFADLSILDNTSYVKNDAIYINAIIDTSKIIHP